MKFKLLILAAITACGLAAQVNESKISAAVPFAFEVKGVKMPAGRYELVRTARNSFLMVTNAATGQKVAVMAGATSDGKAQRSSLEFKRYNGVYFLSAVEFGDAQRKFAVTSSPREKEMAIAIQPELIIARAE